LTIIYDTNLYFTDLEVFSTVMEVYRFENEIYKILDTKKYYNKNETGEINTAIEKKKVFIVIA
jgi:hypothetical protein